MTSNVASARGAIRNIIYFSAALNKTSKDFKGYIATLITGTLFSKLGIMSINK